MGVPAAARNHMRMQACIHSQERYRSRHSLTMARSGQIPMMSSMGWQMCEAMCSQLVAINAACRHQHRRCTCMRVEISPMGKRKDGSAGEKGHQSSKNEPECSGNGIA
jgi:hypothetical protein